MAKKEQNEFEIARKKRQKKFAAQRMRKFIGALLITVLVLAGIYLFISEDIAGIIGDRIVSSTKSGEGLPVDISGMTVKDTFAVGEHIGIMTDAVYFLYAQNGKQLLSAQHGFANPVVESSGRRFLIYDQGGNKLMIRMRDKILFEKEFEYKIISADLSSDGSLSVITSAQRYASQLHVFNKEYEEELFTWSASNEYIVSATADFDKKIVAAAALSANEYGEMVTTVHVFTTEAAVELSKREFKGASVLSLALDNNGDVKVVCDTISAVMDKEGHILGSSTYSSVPAAAINIPGKDGIALIFDRFTEARCAEVHFLGENFETVKAVSISGKYTCSDGDSSKYAVYSSGIAYVFNNFGECTAKLESEQDAHLIQLGKDELFAITRDQFCLIES